MKNLKILTLGFLAFMLTSAFAKEKAEEGPVSFSGVYSHNESLEVSALYEGNPIQCKIMPGDKFKMEEAVGKYYLTTETEEYVVSGLDFVKVGGETAPGGEGVCSNGTSIIGSGDMECDFEPGELKCSFSEILPLTGANLKAFHTYKDLFYEGR